MGCSAKKRAGKTDTEEARRGRARERLFAPRPKPLSPLFRSLVYSLHAPTN